MRFIIKTIRMSLLCAGLALAWLIYFANSGIQLKTETESFDIEAGSRFRGVTHQLVQQNIIQDPVSFEVIARVLGVASDVKAGIYEVKSGITPLELLDMMTSGSSAQVSITFIEGWTFAQMREALNASEKVKHMTMSETDQQILKEIGAAETMPEGLFFPDTYFFTPNTSDRDILKRAYSTMQSKVKNAWATKANGLPYRTAYEALIMASIVEKETGRAVERPQIAGVFINRLKIGMRLQTDPTVIYGMGEHFDGNIHKKDLLSDTVYNTYTRDGLPPTPIAMPGLGAINAALHPAQTKALYFVGKGDGTHHFSTSLTEHNNAVIKYQLGGNRAR
jgi:UPF0755 protein